MRLFVILTVIITGIMSAGIALSQEDSLFQVTALTDNIYKLTTDGGGYTVKVIAMVGDDGLLLVETGQKETSEVLQRTLKTLSPSGPDVIISSHEHVEHIGGNVVFGKSPVVIGHTNLRPRLRSGVYLFDEFPEEIYPDLTFTDSLTLFFNGEEIKLIAFPGSHSDNDIIVWFTGAKIVYVGALSNGSHFPSVDEMSGDVLKYPEVVKRVIDILPDDVMIIPGHGEDGDMDDFRAFYDMLKKTRDIVKEGLALEKDLATLQEEDVLKDFASFEGSYVDRNQWIKYLVDGFQKPDHPLEAIYEPVYYALKEKGLDGCIDYYYDLKANHSDRYRFMEDELVYIAYKLYKNERYNEAVRFFELTIEEYPGGGYLELSHYFAGSSYNKLGDQEAAIRHLKKALELNPDNTHAVELLKELEG